MWTRSQEVSNTPRLGGFHQTLFLLASSTLEITRLACCILAPLTLLGHRLLTLRQAAISCCARLVRPNSTRYTSTSPISILKVSSLTATTARSSTWLPSTPTRGKINQRHRLPLSGTSYPWRIWRSNISHTHLPLILFPLIVVITACFPSPLAPSLVF